MWDVDWEPAFERWTAKEMPHPTVVKHVTDWAAEFEVSGVPQELCLPYPLDRERFMARIPLTLIFARFIAVERERVAIILEFFG